MESNSGRFGSLEVLSNDVNCDKGVFYLDPGKFSIGSNIACKIRLFNADKVGSHHCFIQVSENGVASLLTYQNYFQHPTRVNNRIIRPKKLVFLKPGDVLNIGDILMQYKNDFLSEEDIKQLKAEPKPFKAVYLNNTPRKIPATSIANPSPGVSGLKEKLFTNIAYRPAMAFKKRASMIPKSKQWSTTPLKSNPLPSRCSVPDESENIKSNDDDGDGTEESSSFIYENRRLKYLSSSQADFNNTEDEIAADNTIAQEKFIMPFIVDKTNTSKINTTTEKNTSLSMKNDSRSFKQIASTSGDNSVILIESSVNMEAYLSDEIESDDDTRGYYSAESLTSKTQRQSLKETNSTNISATTSSTYSPGRNNVSNSSSTQTVMKSPKLIKVSADDISNLSGVKELFKTSNLSKSLKKEPLKLNKTRVNKTLNYSGIKQMFTTPNVALNTESSDSSVDELSDVNTEIAIKSTHKNFSKIGNDSLSTSGLGRMFKTPKKVNTPSDDIENLSGMEKIFETPNNDIFAKKILKTSTAIKNNSLITSGIDRLFKTPKTIKTPKHDLTNLAVMEETFDTPNTDNLDTNLSAKSVLKVKVMQADSHDISDFGKGMRRTFKTPKAPNNASFNVTGINCLFDNFTVREDSPTKDNSESMQFNYTGAQKLFDSPSLENSSEIRSERKISKTSKPKMLSIEKSTSNNLSGIEEIPKSPKRSFVNSNRKNTRSRMEDTSESSSESDYSAEREEMVIKNKTPTRSSARSRTSSVQSSPSSVRREGRRMSVDELLDSMLTVKKHDERQVMFPIKNTFEKCDYTNVEGVKHMFAKEEAAAKNDCNVSGVADIFNDSEDTFTRVFNKKPVRTYRGKSTSPMKSQNSPSINVSSSVSSPVITSDTVNWVQHVNDQWDLPDAATPSNSSLNKTGLGSARKARSLLRENVKPRAGISTFNSSTPKRNVSLPQSKENISPVSKNGTSIHYAGQQEFISDMDCYFSDDNNSKMNTQGAPYKNETNKSMLEGSDEDTTSKEFTSKSPARKINIDQDRNCMSEKIVYKRISCQNPRYSIDFMSDTNKHKKNISTKRQFFHELEEDNESLDIDQSKQTTVAQPEASIKDSFIANDSILKEITPPKWESSRKLSISTTTGENISECRSLRKSIIGETPAKHAVIDDESIVQSVRRGHLSKSTTKKSISKDQSENVDTNSSYNTSTAQESPILRGRSSRSLVRKSFGKSLTSLNESTSQEQANKNTYNYRTDDLLTDSVYDGSTKKELPSRRGRLTKSLTRQSSGKELISAEDQLDDDMCNISENINATLVADFKMSQELPRKRGRPSKALPKVSTDKISIPEAVDNNESKDMIPKNLVNDLPRKRLRSSKSLGRQSSGKNLFSAEQDCSTKELYNTSKYSNVSVVSNVSVTQDSPRKRGRPSRVLPSEFSSKILTSMNESISQDTYEVANNDEPEDMILVNFVNEDSPQNPARSSKSLGRQSSGKNIISAANSTLRDCSSKELYNISKYSNVSAVSDVNITQETPRKRGRPSKVSSTESNSKNLTSMNESTLQDTYEAVDSDELEDTISEHPVNENSPQQPARSSKSLGRQFADKSLISAANSTLRECSSKEVYNTSKYSNVSAVSDVNITQESPRKRGRPSKASPTESISKNLTSMNQSSSQDTYEAADNDELKEMISEHPVNENLPQKTARSSKSLGRQSSGKNLISAANSTLQDCSSKELYNTSKYSNVSAVSDVNMTQEAPRKRGRPSKASPTEANSKNLTSMNESTVQETYEVGDSDELEDMISKHLVNENSPQKPARSSKSLGRQSSGKNLISAANSTLQDCSSKELYNISKYSNVSAVSDVNITQETPRKRGRPSKVSSTESNSKNLTSMNESTLQDIYEAVDSDELEDTISEHPVNENSPQQPARSSKSLGRQFADKSLISAANSTLRECSSKEVYNTSKYSNVSAVSDVNITQESPRKRGRPSKASPTESISKNLTSMNESTLQDTYEAADNDELKEMISEHPVNENLPQKPARSSKSLGRQSSGKNLISAANSTLQDCSSKDVYNTSKYSNVSAVSDVNMTQESPRKRGRPSKASPTESNSKNLTSMNESTVQETYEVGDGVELEDMISKHLVNENSPQKPARSSKSLGRQSSGKNLISAANSTLQDCSSKDVYNTSKYSNVSAVSDVNMTQESPRKRGRPSKASPTESNSKNLTSMNESTLQDTYEGAGSDELEEMISEHPVNEDSPQQPARSSKSLGRQPADKSLILAANSTLRECSSKELYNTSKYSNVSAVSDVNITQELPRKRGRPSQASPTESNSKNLTSMNESTLQETYEVGDSDELEDMISKHLVNENSPQKPARSSKSLGRQSSGKNLISAANSTLRDCSSKEVYNTSKYSNVSAVSDVNITQESPRKRGRPSKASPTESNSKNLTSMNESTLQDTYEAVDSDELEEMISEHPVNEDSPQQPARSSKSLGRQPADKSLILAANSTLRECSSKELYNTSKYSNVSAVSDVNITQESLRKRGRPSQASPTESNSKSLTSMNESTLQETYEVGDSDELEDMISKHLVNENSPQKPARSSKSLGRQSSGKNLISAANSTLRDCLSKEVYNTSKYSNVSAVSDVNITQESPRKRGRPSKGSPTESNTKNLTSMNESTLQDTYEAAESDELEEMISEHPVNEDSPQQPARPSKSLGRQSSGKNLISAANSTLQECSSKELYNTSKYSNVSAVSEVNITQESPRKRGRPSQASPTESNSKNLTSMNESTLQDTYEVGDSDELEDMISKHLVNENSLQKPARSSKSLGRQSSGKNLISAANSTLRDCSSKDVYNTSKYSNVTAVSDVTITQESPRKRGRPSKASPTESNSKNLTSMNESTLQDTYEAAESDELEEMISEHPVNEDSPQQPARPSKILGRLSSGKNLISAANSTLQECSSKELYNTSKYSNVSAVSEVNITQESPRKRGRPSQASPTESNSKNLTSMNESTLQDTYEVGDSDELEEMIAEHPVNEDSPQQPARSSKSLGRQSSGKNLISAANSTLPDCSSKELYNTSKDSNVSAVSEVSITQESPRKRGRPSKATPTESNRKNLTSMNESTLQDTYEGADSYELVDMISEHPVNENSPQKPARSSKSLGRQSSGKNLISAANSTLRECSSKELYNTSKYSNVSAVSDVNITQESPRKRDRSSKASPTESNSKNLTSMNVSTLQATYETADSYELEDMISEHPVNENSPQQPARSSKSLGRQSPGKNLISAANSTLRECSSKEVYNTSKYSNVIAVSEVNITQESPRKRGRPSKASPTESNSKDLTSMNESTSQDTYEVAINNEPDMSHENCVNDDLPQQPVRSSKSLGRQSSGKNLISAANSTLQDCSSKELYNTSTYSNVGVVSEVNITQESPRKRGGSRKASPIDSNSKNLTSMNQSSSQDTYEAAEGDELEDMISEHPVNEELSQKFVGQSHRSLGRQSSGKNLISAEEFTLQNCSSKELYNTSKCSNVSSAPYVSVTQESPRKCGRPSKASPTKSNSRIVTSMNESPSQDAYKAVDNSEPENAIPENLVNEDSSEKLERLSKSVGRKSSGKNLTFVEESTFQDCSSRAAYQETSEEQENKDVHKTEDLSKSMIFWTMQQPLDKCLISADADLSCKDLHNSSQNVNAETLIKKTGSIVMQNENTNETSSSPQKTKRKKARKTATDDLISEKVTKQRLNSLPIEKVSAVNNILQDASLELDNTEKISKQTLRKDKLKRVTSEKQPANDNKSSDEDVVKFTEEVKMKPSRTRSQRQIKTKDEETNAKASHVDKQLDKTKIKRSQRQIQTEHKTKNTDQNKNMEQQTESKGTRSHNRRNKSEDLQKELPGRVLRIRKQPEIKEETVKEKDIGNKVHFEDDNELNTSTDGKAPQKRKLTQSRNFIDYAENKKLQKPTRGVKRNTEDSDSEANNFKCKRIRSEEVDTSQNVNAETLIKKTGSIVTQNENTNEISSSPQQTSNKSQKNKRKNSRKAATDDLISEEVSKQRDSLPIKKVSAVSNTLKDASLALDNTEKISKQTLRKDKLKRVKSEKQPAKDNKSSDEDVVKFTEEVKLKPSRTRSQKQVKTKDEETNSNDSYSDKQEDDTKIKRSQRRIQTENKTKNIDQKKNIEQETESKGTRSHNRQNKHEDLQNEPPQRVVRFRKQPEIKEESPMSIGKKVHFEDENELKISTDSKAPQKRMLRQSRSFIDCAENKLQKPIRGANRNTKDSDSEENILKTKRSRSEEVKNVVAPAPTESKRPLRGQAHKHLIKNEEVNENRTARSRNTQDLSNKEVSSSSTKKRNLELSNEDLYNSEKKRPRRGQKPEIVEIKNEPDVQNKKPHQSVKKQKDVEVENKRPRRGQKQDEIIIKTEESNELVNKRVLRGKAKDSIENNEINTNKSFRGKKQKPPIKDEPITENERTQCQEQTVVKEEPIENKKQQKSKNSEINKNKNDTKKETKLDKPSERVTRGAVHPAETPVKRRLRLRK